MTALLIFSLAPAWAHNAGGADITVTPSTNLTDGQSILVLGTGFGAGDPIQIDQCAANESSCILRDVVTSDFAGTFSDTVNVSKSFTGNNGFVDCAVSGCVLHAQDVALGQGQHATEAITFTSSGNVVPPGLTCGGLSPTIVGTDASNVLVGTAGNDVIAALGGDDIVRGLGGDDIICGGDGRDKLKGGLGRDQLFGEAGRDKLNGGGSKDSCFGGADKDAIGCEKAKQN